MTSRCPVCGAVSVGLCHTCSVGPSDEEGTADPLIGKTIADRYEIISLINIGGMGRVYRANQRSLGREVAVKFIHPHLTSSHVLVERFMTEAHAASRLNHPHVVSVFDFGQTLEADGGELFLIMELLTGVDLGSVMRREGPLPFARVGVILGQTLEALGEAHRLGITHRDVKPDNMILTLRSLGRDHVKVIDFGIAKVATSRKITQNGQICGTPAYMAPEQACGGEIDPRVDLYSLGVVMFQMLTGRLPFEGPTPSSTLNLHLTAARPDPRRVAPQRSIPDSLARICLQALAIDPRLRFQSADAFAEALARGEWAHPSERAPWARTELDPSLTRPRDDDTLPILEGPPQRAAAPRSGHQPGPAPKGHDELLLDREQELAWARDLLRGRGPLSAMAFWGRPGVGRSRLLAEVAKIGELEGALLVRIPLAPAPRHEVGYGGLRTMIWRLSGLTANELLHAQGKEVADPWAWAGLCAAFKDAPSRLPDDPAAVRRAAGAALGWAARRAARRASGARALMVIDDLDRLDGASQRALGDLLEADPIPGFTVLMTDERSPRGAFDRVPARVLRGLSRADAARMLVQRGEPASLSRLDEDIEPLYIDQLARLTPPLRRTAPTALAELVAWRVQELPPAQRRTLQAVAITGGGSVDQLALLLPRPGEVHEALGPLCDGGFVTLTGGEATVTHALVSRAAIAAAPGGAVAELHDAATGAMAPRHELVELRAYHAIRGTAGFQAFLLIEETARIRTVRGDDKGAIAALWEAMRAARSQLLRGEIETASAALSVFGRKLATALADDGRIEEARGVLCEVDEGASNPGLCEAAPVRPVLVVEDDKSIREGLRSVIESDGREAFVAANGREALDVLRRIRRPGLILLDLMMPVMSGWELLASLRADEDFATIPVVVVSAIPSTDDLGVARIVQKPVEVATLLHIVQEFCG